MSILDKRALVIGGGVGGLAAAIALRQAGWEPVVFERTPTIAPVGAGLSLWANAIEALRSLGMGVALDQMSAPGVSGGVRSWRGELLTSFAAEPLKAFADPPIIAVHRADLHEALRTAAGPGTLRTATRCTGFSQDERGVGVRFADGREERGALLVGADGLRSVVREQLWGAQLPRYVGQTAWRAVVQPRVTLLPDGVGYEYWGRGAVFGIVPMSRGRIYWYAAANAPEGGSDHVGGHKGKLLDLFRGWDAPIEALIASSDETRILHNDIYDRSPLAHWSNGRVTLLGDAAHPMTPNLGQGACQALEDAVALGASLVGTNDIPAALLAYERQRIPRTTSIVQLSRRMNWATQINTSLGCWLRNQAMRFVPANAQIAQFKQVMNLA